MTQTTTQLGRAQLSHPDIGFDTDDGGTALHNTMATMFAAISNHLPSRWTGSVTLADQASTTVNHYFNLALSKLTVMIFEAGVQLTELQKAAAYTITQTSVNAISIKNNSGGSKTFDALVLAFITEVPDAYWDSINGTSWNKSLYKNGNYTVSTPQEFENVIILGDLTLNANLTVRGRLVVVGNITGSGYKFDCDGDVYISGTASISGIAAPTMTIGGSLINITSNTMGFVFVGNSGTKGKLTVKKDITIVNSSNAIKLLTLGSTGNCAGNDLVVYGNVRASIMAGGAGKISNVGQSGGIIKILGSLYAGPEGTYTNGSSGTSGYASGNGGDISIGGDFISSGGGVIVNTSGGNSTGANAGNAGSISVGGDLIGGQLILNGGVATTSGIGGYGGSVLAFGDIVVDSIDSSGGYAAVGSAYSAGNAGWVQSYNGNINVLGNITMMGGNGGNSPISGGNLSCIDLQVDSVSLRGGNHNGGSGGNITVNGDLKSSIQSQYSTVSCNGGENTLAGISGGIGGNITVYRNVVDVSLIASGGACGPGLNTGSGGSITVWGEVIGSTVTLKTSGGTFNVSAGAIGSAGSAGNIVVKCSFNSKAGSILAEGSTNDYGGASAGGAGGNITINSNCVANIIKSTGGSVTTSNANSSYNGGAAGQIIVYGNLQIRTLLNGNGGSTTYGTGNGGSSSQVQIYGDLHIDMLDNNAQVDIRGGDSSGGNGGQSYGLYVTGNLLCMSNADPAINIRGGDSTKSSGSASGGNSSGITVDGNLNMRRGTINIRGGDCTNSGLTTGIGGNNGRAAIGDSPANRVGGDFKAGDPNNLSSHLIRGGNGRTAGGHSGGLAVFGNISLHGTLDNSGGNATNGSGTVGSLGVLHLFGGGTIYRIWAKTNVGSVEGSGSGKFIFAGTFNIGHWMIPSSYYPNARYTVRTPITGVSASIVYIFSKPENNPTCFDAGNGNNYFPSGAVALNSAGPSWPMTGYDTSGSATVWKYRTFANA